MSGKITRFLFNIRSHAVFLYFSAFLLISASINHDITRREFLAAVILALIIQCYYIFNKLEDVEEDLLNGESPLFENNLANRMKVMFFSAFLLALCCFIFPELMPLVLWGWGSILVYRRAKRIFLLKTFLVVFNFSLMAVFTPFSLNGLCGYSAIPSVLFSNMHFSIMIFVVTIVLDIRDEKGDREAGVKSLPAIVGVRNTFLVIAGMLLLHFYFLGEQTLRVKAMTGAYYLFFLLMTWLGYKVNKLYYDFLQLFSGVIIFVVALAVSGGRS